ncbi:hypothetical protein FIA58_011200 [Flavobacterium jejuense]|uniref:Uncharacterized protein n=1 Tax=Flavobacterium jejuense TaxID=1544455 RepID=A0ABX0IWR0_9FLAO|nr:hypothetical protein [Flavobacterium jejuense]NHN26244.1 hypothetical protein [Flavobacterium jejuense]
MKSLFSSLIDFSNSSRLLAFLKSVNAPSKLKLSSVNSGSFSCKETVLIPKIKELML